MVAEETRKAGRQWLFLYDVCLVLQASVCVFRNCNLFRSLRFASCFLSFTLQRLENYAAEGMPTYHLGNIRNLLIAHDHDVSEGAKDKAWIEV